MSSEGLPKPPHNLTDFRISWGSIKNYQKETIYKPPALVVDVLMKTPGKCGCMTMDPTLCALFFPISCYFTWKHSLHPLDTRRSPLHLSSFIAIPRRDIWFYNFPHLKQKETTYTDISENGKHPYTKHIALTIYRQPGSREITQNLKGRRKFKSVGWAYKA